MTWTTLLPAAASSGGVVAPVTLAVSKAGKVVQRAFLTVRPDLVDDPACLEWWTYGARVTVQLGQDAHAGILRIVPGGAWSIGQPTGRRAKAGRPNAPCLILRGLPAAPPAGLKSVALEFEYSDGWIEIVLPWAKAAAPAAPAVPPAKFRSVVSREGLGHGVGRPSRAAVG